ncbi:unnamed protein product, partial [Mycena citricolor]
KKLKLASAEEPRNISDVLGGSEAFQRRLAKRKQRMLDLEANGAEDSSRTKKKTAGRPRDTLVDDLIVTESYKVDGKQKVYTYCIACDHCEVFRNPGRIRKHAAID